MKAFFITGMLVFFYSIVQAQDFPLRENPIDETEFSASTAATASSPDASTSYFELSLEQPDSKMVQLLTIVPEDVCYDEMNHTWFEQFNLLQEQGHDVHQADGLARDAAVLAYKLCSRLNMVYINR